MTTGRINQVTTVCAATGKPDRGAQAQRRWTGSSSLEGTPKESARGQRSGAPDHSPGHSIAPTGFPKKRSAAEGTRDPVEATIPLRHRPLKRRVRALNTRVPLRISEPTSLQEL